MVTRNREAFITLANAIRDAGERFSQHNWSSIALTYDNDLFLDPVHVETLCGSAYCIAGWNQYLQGRLVNEAGEVYKISTDDLNPNHYIVGDYCGPVDLLAMSNLGLTQVEADYLFDSKFVFNDSPYEGLMAIANGAIIEEVGIWQRN